MVYRVQKHHPSELLARPFHDQLIARTELACPRPLLLVEGVERLDQSGEGLIQLSDGVLDRCERAFKAMMDDPVINEFLKV